ncbi:hypothetical protein DSD19_20645 [Rhodovulum sp. BSW8]|uniref:hypothetical protein n=1 Tax=Rhodovulum sp. BSW8 TaxID=2259645 RepID=UPI000DE1CE9A|nr:hypothetical protein [Rhodovulum sp. BSW8]RBO51239.1 hypothetical protein DSD19_20645 [Rhodovulum sp. BSW8]
MIRKAPSRAVRQTPSPAATRPVSALQDAADSSPATRALRTLQTKAQGAAQSGTTAPLQLKSRQTVSGEFLNGGYAANMTIGFFGHHIALNGHDNLAAVRTHAARNPPPQTNTVIMDAHALKTGLAAGAWADLGNAWRVTTAGNVTLQDTTKAPGPFNGGFPGNAALLPPATTGADADRFTVANGVVTAVTDATQQEVANAVAQIGAYPPGTKKDRRRDYRKRLVEAINAARTAAAEAGQAAWVTGNFSQIGATPVANNPAVTTLAEINAIAKRQAQVSVRVDKDSGNIFHYGA